MTLVSQISSANGHFYDAAGARAVDAAAWRALGDSDGFRLMQRAGRSALNFACAAWPDATSLAIFCGAGNNGGDGYVVAELARRRGVAVRVWATAPPRSAEAIRARDAFAGRGGLIESTEDFAADVVPDGALIVDALLGTGLSRSPDAHLAGLINAMNVLPNPVLSLDVPTGLDADTGATPGVAVEADATLSFIVAKTGLVTGRGPALCGECHVDDLTIATTALAAATPVADRITPERNVVSALKRRADSHKGTHGHVLVIGGNASMGGAALLCARGALRAGAGLVSLATGNQNVSAAQVSVPEAMTRGVADASDLKPLLQRASVVAIGPGLGLDDWAVRLFGAAADSGLPMVIDADALTLLAGGAGISDSDSGEYVLTPHPGEAGRLLGTDAQRVNQDRLGAAHQMAQRYRSTVLLKGAGTVVADASANASILTAGNPGMATGGMGDVLTGIIAALIAQGLAPHTAARTGAWMHACAADLLADAGSTAGYSASQVADALPAARTVMETRTNGL